MKIIINGKPFEMASIPSTFGEFINILATDQSFLDGIIVSLTIDGAEIDIPAFDAPFPLNAEYDQLMELQIEDKLQILTNANADAKELLILILEQISLCVEHLRGGRNQQGNEVLIGLVEKIQIFVNYIAEIVKFIDRKFKNVPDGDKIVEINKKILDVMKQLLESQENKDLVLLADLLEFELLPLMKQWSDILNGPIFNLNQ